MRHCCVVPLGFCHWHRCVFLMACTPHISFIVVDFSLIIVCIVCPSMGCGGVFVLAGEGIVNGLVIMRL